MNRPKKIKSGIHKESPRSMVAHVLSIMMIMILALANIKDLNLLTVMNDEFGYWSNAALVAGYDWKDLAMNTPYYSFGYSLVLIPLFWIFKSTATMYRAAIILNALMLCVSYFCCYFTLKRMPHKASDEYLAAISGAVMLMCGDLFHMKIAWCETFMTMLMWLMVFLIGRLEEKFRYKDYAAIHIIMLLMYITHQRTIGIFISLFMIMFLILYKHKKKKLIILTGLGIVGIYFAQKGMRIFQDNLIDNSRVTSTNVLSVQADVIEDYANKISDNIIYLSQSIAGKLLYALIATFGSMVIGAKDYLKELFGDLKKRKFDKGFLVKSFIVMSFLIMFALDAVQMMTGYRWDVVVYSRYMEFTIFPVAAYSFMCYADSGKKARYLLFGGFIGAVGMFIYLVRTVWSQYGEFFNVTCSPLIGGFYQFGGRTHIEMMCVFIVIVLTVSILILSFTAHKEGSVHLIPVLVVFVIFNIFMCSYADKWLNKSRVLFHKNTDPVYKILKSDYRDDELYFIKDDENNYCSPNVKFLQFMLGNREIHVIESIDEVKEDAIVIVNSNYELEDDSGCEEIESTGYLTVYDYSVK
jgi:hypothetical protein